jgi:predicted transcriptional regulator
MQNAKEMAHQLIERLPDTATFDDIVYEFYVRQKIEAGLKAVNEGRTISHEEARKRLLGNAD